MAPTVSQLILDGLIRPEAVPQLETFQAGITFARTEGFISAPETNHAIAMLIREAIKAREEGKEKVILMNWSGHGLVDMGAYEAQYVDVTLSKAVLPPTAVPGVEPGWLS